MLELKFIKGSLYNLLLSLSHFAPLGFFPTHVYYKLKFITEKFSKIAHGEILSEEEFFGEFHEILSLIVQVTHMLVSLKRTVLQNIVLIR